MFNEGEGDETVSDKLDSAAALGMFALAAPAFGQENAATPGAAVADATSTYRDHHADLTSAINAKNATRLRLA